MLKMLKSRETDVDPEADNEAEGVNWGFRYSTTKSFSFLGIEISRLSHRDDIELFNYQSTLNRMDSLNFFII